MKPMGLSVLNREDFESCAGHARYHHMCSFFSLQMMAMKEDMVRFLAGEEVMIR